MFFLSLLIGNFDNSEQFKDFENNGVKDFPFAEHVNTVCNNKIKNLPENFKGKFLLEESYYTSNGKNMHHHIYFCLQKKQKE